MGRFLIQIIQAENLKFVVYDDLCFFLNGHFQDFA